MRHSNSAPFAGTLALLLALAACSEPQEPLALSSEQEAFWTELTALCGLAFPGTMRMGPESSDWWDASSMVMHVRSCQDDEIRIPLHVDEDRSRTWVLRRTPAGLALTHDHRQADGTPDTSNTDYGGHTTDAGSQWRQVFPADAYSVGVVALRASQHWFLELRPGQDFSYGLLREATGLRYLVEFDLTTPVEAPPPPWGAEQDERHPDESPPEDPA